MEELRKARVERYIRGVYGGDPSVVDELAGDEIVSSYPIFTELFGAPTVRGREAMKQFVNRFGSRWTQARLSVHEAIEEGDRVVLVWSFRARRRGAGGQGQPPTDKEHRWGGITLFRFNSEGKIVAEIGEESSPGPFARLG